MKKDILIINTGGTFNKVYNPINGENEIRETPLPDLLSQWGVDYETINIIQKDSLFFTDDDRDILLRVINKYNKRNIVVIHGTDTMIKSAKFIQDNIDHRKIVFTGAMVPYSMENTEASANLASAIALLYSDFSGVWISMGDTIGSCTSIKKDKKLGKFIFEE